MDGRWLRDSCGCRRCVCPGNHRCGALRRDRCGCCRIAGRRHLRNGHAGRSCRVGGGRSGDGDWRWSRRWRRGHRHRGGWCGNVCGWNRGRRRGRRSWCTCRNGRCCRSWRCCWRGADWRRHWGAHAWHGRRGGDRRCCCRCCRGKWDTHGRSRGGVHRCDHGRIQRRDDRSRRHAHGTLRHPHWSARA